MPRNPKKTATTEPTIPPVKKPTREEAAESLAIIRGFLQWLPTQPHPQKKDATSPGDTDPHADKETPHEPNHT